MIPKGIQTIEPTIEAKIISVIIIEVVEDKPKLTNQGVDNCVDNKPVVNQ